MKDNLEFTFKDLKNKILNPTSKQVRPQLNYIKDLHKALTKTLVAIIEKKISDIVIDYNIETIKIEPACIYNKQDYDKYFVYIDDKYYLSDTKYFSKGKYYISKTTKIVPKYSEKADDINFYNLKEKIDNELMPLRPLGFIFKKDITFNIPELRANFANQKLGLDEDSLAQKNDILFQLLKKDEILKLSNKELDQKIEEIKKVCDTLNKIVTDIIEEKISKIIIPYDIEVAHIWFHEYETHDSIVIEHSHCFDREHNVPTLVPKHFKNAENIDFASLDKRIKNELNQVKQLFLFFKTDSIEFNIPELRTKYTNSKLKENISMKKISEEEDSNIKCNKKYVFQELTEKDILELTPEQLQTKAEEIDKIRKALSRMTKAFVEKKISEVAIYYDIETVNVNPFFDKFDVLFDGKGFYSSYSREKRIPMYFKNDKYVSYLNLENKFENSLASLNPLNTLIGKQIIFNVPELRNKYLNQKLESDKDFSKAKCLYTDNNIEYTFQELTKDEIVKLDSEKLKEKIEEVTKTYNILNKMSEVIIKSKLARIIPFYEIETIGFEPFYFSHIKSFKTIINGEDVYYKRDKIIPKSFKDAETISFRDLEKKINDEIKLLKPLINKSIEFSASELMSIYMHHKLEKDLSIKNSQTRSLCYKM